MATDISALQNELSELLARARAPQTLSDPAQLDQVATALRDFIDRTPASSNPDVTALLKIAMDTQQALLRGAIDDRLAAIAARTKEFEALTERIQQRTYANTQAAKSIGLEQITTAVKAATDAVAAIKELKAAVLTQKGAPGELDALAGKLEKAMAALQAFNGAVAEIR